MKDAHAGKLDLELLDTSSLSSPQSEEDDNSFSSSLIAIGRFCDTDIPLIYCARKITSLFLLTKEKGVLTPREKARVSVKVKFKKKEEDS